MTIGILPCAGSSERFGGLPKFLLPCPEGYLLKYHVDLMIAAGVSVAGVVTNETNYPFAHRDGINPTEVERFSTMTETVLSCYHNTIVDLLYDKNNVLFGMPDTYLHSTVNPYEAVSNMLVNSFTIDLVIGCWKPRPFQWREGGMVTPDSGYSVLDVVDKPHDYPKDSYIWGVMAWRPSFWECLTPDMPHVGYGIMPAVRKGLKVSIAVFDGDYYDCGTFERYAEMIRDVTCESE